MAQINPNFLSLKHRYLFQQIREYVEKNKHRDLINLGVGDVVNPVNQVSLQAMHIACDELGHIDTFKGYGPACGYPFLKKAIQSHYYSDLAVDEEEIFISDGACCDISDFQELFASSNRVGILNPSYPVYVDTNILAGREIVDIPLLEEHDFKPQIPKEQLDLIYLCFPHNPTGTTLTKAELSEWVAYAKYHGSIILFDGAYEGFISSEDVPHSIYEVDGAEEVCVEFRSFSKCASFTGLRCSFTVVPKKVKNGLLHNLWKTRQELKRNGIAYPIQKAAAAALSKEGYQLCLQDLKTYMNQAKQLKKALDALGQTSFGGVDCPYIWWKTQNNMSSWQFFSYLLETLHIVCVPGEGFGKYGEGYVRLSAFAPPETIKRSIKSLTTHTFAPCTTV